MPAPLEPRQVQVTTSSTTSSANEDAVSRARREEYSEHPAFLKFLGLREQPFDLTPSPRYFYPSASIQSLSMAAGGTSPRAAKTAQ